MKLGELATLIDTQIVCRYPDSNGKWYAELDNVEVMDKGCLESAAGRGTCPEAAIQRYVAEIVGKRIAINAGRVDRREFVVPISLEA
jgi:hypothetical protein